MRRILICDDEEKIVDNWARQLRSLFKRLQIEFEIQPLSDPAEFWAEISVLEERREGARKRNRRNPAPTKSQFDKADILIVDYDLIKLSQLDQERMSYVTAESVAYLCRCYSRCGLIVVLNQYGTNPFDLTLRGHPESYADLNLGSEQLANPGLWSEKWTGFRPWYWPLLPRACDALASRTKALVNNLGESVIEHLRLPEEVANALPRATAEFLGPRKKPQDTTFTSFVMESGNGLQRKDKALDDESIARIAAARLGKWLERLVLPGQDVLVDAPHLVSRFPSLLKGNLRNVATWDKTTSFTLRNTSLHTNKVEKYQFRSEAWLSRPAWFWKGLSNFEEIKEVKSPWVPNGGPHFVFCEDVSRFLPRKAAREFVADLPSSFVRRYVLDHNSSLAKKFKLRGVEYAPSVRFSL